MQVSIVIPFVRAPTFAYGGFHHRFSGTDWRLRAISARLRALGTPNFLPLAVVTSSRKFERMGIWTSFARVALILLCLRLGRKPPQAFFADIR